MLAFNSTFYFGAYFTEQYFTGFYTYFYTIHIINRAVLYFTLAFNSIFYFGAYSIEFPRKFIITSLISNLLVDSTYISNFYNLH